ncbi:MAG: S1C family serine protease [Candidatus Flexifilum sp.]|jgi:S1-C subfamily serine protease
MAEIFAALSDQLAGALETAGQSIVRVEGRRRQSASGAIWSSDGLIVTAHHVLERDENLRVGLPDGSTVNAQLVGRDPSTDVALLRVGVDGLTPARWAEGNSIRVGHLVMAAARPGERLQAALGIISAIDEAYRTMAGGTIDQYIQADIVMYPGFSGGPLINASGEFIGINSSALARGVSLTIPAAALRRVVDMLLTHGRVRRGYLGISAQAVRLPAAVSAAVGQETGLLLIGVEADSPAERGGLLLGDVIVSLAGDRVRHMDDLMAALSGDRVGRTIPVRVLRGGVVQELSVTIGERA